MNENVDVADAGVCVLSIVLPKMLVDGVDDVNAVPKNGFALFASLPRVENVRPTLLPPKIGLAASATGVDPAGLDVCAEIGVSAVANENVDLASDGMDIG